jgi:hypothetical protein
MYSCINIFKPFYKNNSIFKKIFFIDNYWALAIPIYFEILIICCMLTFTGLVFIISKKKEPYSQEKVKEE